MRFINESSKSTAISVLIVSTLALFGLTKKNFDLEEASLFQRVMVEVMAPVQQGITHSQKSFSSLFENYLKIVNTSKKNQSLRMKIARLESDLFSAEEIRKENLRLKKLLNYSEEVSEKRIMAQVIGWDSANEFKVIRLNKGASAGVQVMAPVITHEGLVGYVYRVTEDFADVLTILDPNNRVDVLVERTRTHAILEGIYNYRCTLKYVMTNENIEVGDKLLTAGVGGIYPKGIKVGMISDISRENFGLTLTIDVQPSVDFDKLEEVLVIIPKLAPAVSAPEQTDKAGEKS